MTAKVTLTVPDISCEHCVRAVTGALQPIEGVEAVAVDLPSKQVTVAYDPDRANIDQLTTALAEEEYPVAAISEAR